MFQRGPGEGYHAAKDYVLASEPGCRCRKVRDGHRVVGFIVERENKIIGRGRSAREAWNDAKANIF